MIYYFIHIQRQNAFCPMRDKCGRIIISTDKENIKKLIVDRNKQMLCIIDDADFMFKKYFKETLIV